ncbi:hypothetical protein HNQ80_004602 [Anaerosolibacter carboniphilus]|uniref:Uncharacterized protein n=1 Tax=Anaerosolibacter carboniphilus TaxID=1417629 RepID=A0A841L1E9_9FIRM|nr:hypothetical protein [Anaerosolibacter carboniphilus]MBB6218438.1 hypothetical protein [Anaerosolibacter carboniphilus]
MIKNKRVILLLVALFVLASSISGFAATSWSAPNGGVWTFTKTDGSNPILRPETIKYIPYDELALIQANKLTKADLSTIANVIRDKGV